MEFTGSRKVKRPLPVRVVLVRPEYAMNVGMVARVVKNFSVTDLAFVNPQCEIGFEAGKYAKHSAEVLEGAKTFSSLKEAVKGFDLVIGTTGVVRRFTGNLKTCVSLPDAVPLVAGKKVAVVFGPEGNGLDEKEFGQCDVAVHIPADRSHPVLNLSHSVAVMLYALYASGKAKRLYKKASGRELRYLFGLFSQIVDKLEETTLPRLRDPAKAKIAFKRVVSRSDIAGKEIDTLLGVFARIRKSLYSRKR